MTDNYWKKMFGPQSEEFIKGAIAAVETYGIYRDGERQIGSPEKPISKAIEDIREGCKPLESNLVNHARIELERIKAFDEEGDFYGGMTGNAVLELVKVFARQGHSGMSAPLVRQLFDKVADFKPLSPITGDDDEWNVIGDLRFQNKRLSAVFKEEGRCHYIDAIVWKEESGSCFTGRVEELSSSQDITFPFIPKTFYIDVVDVDGEYKIKDRSQLDEVWEYYQKEKSDE